MNENLKAQNKEEKFKTPIKIFIMEKLQDYDKKNYFERSLYTTVMWQCQTTKAFHNQ